MTIPFSYLISQGSTAAESGRSAASSLIYDVVNALLPGGLANIFNWALGIGGVMAFGLIIYNGIVISTSLGNTSKVSGAKQNIWGAVIGIVIIAGGYLILYTINPALLKFEVPAQSTVAPSVQTGQPTSSRTGLLTNSQAVASLEANGFTDPADSSSGKCSNIDNPTCTSFEGFPTTATQLLIALKTLSNCPITITAGTETGHATHGPGQGKVDIANDACITDFFNQYSSGGKNNYFQIPNGSLAGVSVTLEKSVEESSPGYTGPHYHINFDTAISNQPQAPKVVE